MENTKVLEKLLSKLLEDSDMQELMEDSNIGLFIKQSENREKATVEELLSKEKEVAEVTAYAITEAFNEKGWNRVEYDIVTVTTGVMTGVCAVLSQLDPTIQVEDGLLSSVYRLEESIIQSAKDMAVKYALEEHAAKSKEVE